MSNKRRYEKESYGWEGYWEDNKRIGVWLRKINDLVRVKRFYGDNGVAFKSVHIEDNEIVYNNLIGRFSDEKTIAIHYEELH